MNQEFSFSDEEFLKVVNMICAEDHPLGSEFVPITSIQESLDVDRLDSLGIMIFFTWLSELFGIPLTKIEAFTNEGDFALTSIRDFVVENRTKTYQYIDGERLNPSCS